MEQTCLFDFLTPPAKPKKRPVKYPASSIRQQILLRLIEDAHRLAAAFNLRFVKIKAERLNVRRRYGVCYSNGIIKIRLNDLRTGNILRYSSLIDTICHELAHLRYMNHGKRFQRLYRSILEYARKQEIYQPHHPPKQFVLNVQGSK